MSASLSPARSRAALRASARISAELLLVLLGTAVMIWLLGRMWSIVWPLVIGLLITTLTWPFARFLRRRGWPPALAASVVTVLFLAVTAGAVALIAVPVASQSGELTDGVVEGIQRLRAWAAGPPLNIGDDQITGALDTATDRLQNSVGSMLTTLATGVGTVVD
ncbi:AI-2E family transporter, partial [Streptomyces sp. NPDC058757]